MGARRWVSSVAIALALAACGKAPEGTCEEANDCLVAGDDDGGAPNADGANPSSGDDSSASGGDDATTDAGSDARGSADGAGDDAPSDDGGRRGDDGGEAGVTCGPGLKLCGAACVSIDDTSYGCTATGCTPCDEPNATIKCAAGACAIDHCAAGWGDCTAAPGCETSLESATHCGSCTNDCDSGLCVTGDGGVPSCGLTCPASAPTNCSGSCVDLTSNDQHCGNCTTSCTAPTGGATKCVSSKCAPSCPTNWELCNNGASCFDVQNDNQHCGNCTTVCTAPTNGTSAQCTAGKCVPTCDATFHACGTGCYSDSDLPNSNPNDPCIISEPYGIFVSSSQGSDTTGKGTRAAPYKTIQQGIDAAITAKKRVYVCAESYAESNTLQGGNVSIFGYFDCAGGTWTVGTGHAIVTAPVGLGMRVVGVTGARFEGIEWDGADVSASSGSSSYGMFVVDSTLTLVNVELSAGSGGIGASGSLGAAPSGPQAPCAAGDGKGATTPGANGAIGTASWSSAGYAPAAGGKGNPGPSGDDGTLTSPGSCIPSTCTGGPPTTCKEHAGSTVYGDPGTAGCGGPGGAPGGGASGGGASVALFAWSSTITVTGGALKSANGGNGGAGVAGGAAPTTWANSAGTTGASRTCNDSTCADQGGCDATTDTATGGIGGNGGRGAAGGTGAGGSGGDTYSYYKGGGATVTVTGTTMTQGSAGIGTGPIPGKSGNKGTFNTVN